MIDYKLTIYILLSHFPMALIGSAYKAENINFIAFFYINSYFFIGKLPAIRNIPFTAHTRFIAIKKVYQTFTCQLFQLLQISPFTKKDFFVGLTFTSLPYSFISAAKLFKKRLKVALLTSLPLFSSHSALAVCNRWRCFLAISNTSASFITLSIIGFLPRPDLIFKPKIPSVLYRFSQLFTARAAPAHVAHANN